MQTTSDPQSSATPPTGPGTPEQFEDPEDRLLNEVIFKRDLNEVHLLMDFISGRVDKNLNDTSIVDPNDATQTLSAADVVKRVAAIRYPPPADTTLRSEHAALLLIAKNKLTSLASPARGLTIAYTAMFVGSAAIPGLFRRSRSSLRRLWTRQSPQANSDQLRSTAEKEDKFLNLARSAFPALEPHVVRFKVTFVLLIIFAFVWLGLTALSYWDIAFGRSILQELDQIEHDQSAILQANSDLPAACATQSAKPVPCQQLTVSLPTRKKTADEDLRKLISCEGTACQWAHAMRWGFLLCGNYADPTNQNQTANAQLPPNDLDQTATYVLTVYSTYILPMMFGLLGTVIGAVRSIQAKVRDSILAPRDLVLTLVGLPAGLIAGLVVGLFFSPSGASNPAVQGLAGNLTLGASGLGFLAGYGTESFFRFVDSLFARAFPALGVQNSQPQGDRGSVPQ